MKIVKRVLPVLLIALALAGCGLIDQLKKGVARKASRITSVVATDTVSKEFAIVDIEYVFTGTGISADKVVFSREGSDRQDTLNIVLVGTIYTDLDTLSSNTTYTYKMWVIDGGEMKEYDEVELTTLPAIEVTSPDLAVSGDLTVTWKKISTQDKDYLKYKIEIFQVKAEDLTDIDGLIALMDPLEPVVEVELAESDTEGEYTFSAANYDLPGGYAIKVSTTSFFGSLVDKSSTIKAFVWSE